MPKASHAHHHLVAETADGARTDTVLRRYVDADRLGSDPWYDPACEIQALEVLRPVDLPVPQLLGADIGPLECDVPTLLVSWLPGEPMPDRPTHLDGYIGRLAEVLPPIHAARTSEQLHRYQPYFESDGKAVGDLRPPRWSKDPGPWERALEILGGRRPDHSPRFIHRDYHQGNTLWMGEDLSGVVDWTTGSIGPVGIDLAHMRLNLTWDFSLAVADRFLAASESIGVAGYDPYWDLLDAMEWLSDDPPVGSDEEERHARYEAFVRRAVSQIRS